MESKIRRLISEVETLIGRAALEPLTVSVMGQTGAGKSSLINALLGTELKTDSVRLRTKEIERVVAPGPKGAGALVQLPAEARGGRRRQSSLPSFYRKHLLESDVVVWAIQRDNWSVAADFDAPHHILGPDEEEQRRLMSKITFALTLELAVSRALREVSPAQNARLLAAGTEP